MPFISLSVTGDLPKEKKMEIKTQLGKLIEILPGKAEKGLMLDISDKHSIYYQGEEKPAAAFIDVRLYKASPEEAKSQFFAEVCDMLERVAGVDRQNVYCNFIELSNWASRGAYR